MAEEQAPLFDPDDITGIDGIGGGGVRREDPSESHDAAAQIMKARDMAAVLKVFGAHPSLTYRQAALIIEPEGDYDRVDSLRRRGSDLKGDGFIAYIGREGRCGLFAITDAGRERLRKIA